MALSDVAQLFGERQPARILNVTAIDHISQRADALSRLILQPHRSDHFAIDGRDLLARPQVGDGCRTMLLRDPKRDAAAGATAVEPEHQAWFLRCAAMDKRIDAERAMFADQPRRDLLDEFKTRPPHQRAIA